MTLKGDIKQMKTISIRLDEDQEARLEKLGRELKNSDAGVMRFALDVLWKTVAENKAVPAKVEHQPGEAAA